jgi:glycosyltransferase involved in cell wall biosynthesis
MSLNVLLVGNYEPDNQESMERFCSLMADGLRKQKINVQIIKPKPIFARIVDPGLRASRYHAPPAEDSSALTGSAGVPARPSSFPPVEGAFAPTASGIGKWLGYIDKFVLFPHVLRKAACKADIVHICDHSNAMYVRSISKVPHLITCHDLLAVRAGLGEETYCPLSPMGKILQRWILEGLRSARMIVCDSNATKRDADRLIGSGKDSIRLVLLGLNHPFSVLAKEERARRLAEITGLTPDNPFLLHVGASQPRKNRDGVLRIFAKVSDQFSGQLVFAGEPLTKAQRVLVGQLGISNRVLEVVKPDNNVLEGLYNGAEALIYPSLSEGFGWPIIEAQACGCPVITSNAGPCPEVAGEGALVHEVNDEDGFAASILRLKDASERAKFVQLGFDNLKNYDSEKMVCQYRSIYQELFTAPEAQKEDTNG